MSVLLANGNRAENVAKARELLGVPTPASEPEPDIAKDDGPRVHTRACPCCGSAMIVIEEFARGCEPRWRPTPAPIRIDTS